MIVLNKPSFVLAATLLLTLGQPNAGKFIESRSDNLQKFTFFTNEDYTGDSESFTYSVPNVQDVTIIGRVAKSFCVEKGVWVIYGNITFGPTYQEDPVNPTFDISNGLLANSNLGMVCVSLHDDDNGQSATYTSIRHLASNDLDATSLSLFEERWKGNELFVEGDSLRLPNPMSVTSFAYTGNNPWTLTLSSGEQYCLQPGANDPFLMGISFSDVLESVQVVAAQKGCDESNNEMKNLPVRHLENFTLYPTLSSRIVKLKVFP